ncbi:hypothetical protein MC7420_8206 [Coleofasciculus chthonoplastes PCC 7420]|uniref:Uncharacterized protein n=1 Tax=Coleofasciculus chthonoplastes PCC 7420 TaxID=118168 RepID=B4W4D7_9CYAN|nr:hypothetical protein MC7420_8206 [Coleofasciculus chthonoplastes PCC 7420]
MGNRQNIIMKGQNSPPIYPPCEGAILGEVNIKLSQANPTIQRG